MSEQNKQNRGWFAMFQFNTSSGVWEQLGDNVYTAADVRTTRSYLGRHLEINTAESGHRIAVSSGVTIDYKKRESNANDRRDIYNNLDPSILVYQYKGRNADSDSENSWKKFTSPLFIKDHEISKYRVEDQVTIYDDFTDMSINSSGNRIIVGNPRLPFRSDQGFDTRQGAAQVFIEEDKEFVPLGQLIRGQKLVKDPNTGLENFRQGAVEAGNRVAMNSSGNVIAVNSPGSTTKKLHVNSNVSAGNCRVFTESEKYALRAGEGGTSPFRNDSNLKLWLDASDSSTIFDATAGGSNNLVDGASIARWEDKSGQDNHVVQSEANRRPQHSANSVNDLNTINFVSDSPQDYGAAAGDGMFFMSTVSDVSLETRTGTFFIVFKSNSATGPRSSECPFSLGRFPTSGFVTTTSDRVGIGLFPNSSGVSSQRFIAGAGSFSERYGQDDSQDENPVHNNSTHIITLLGGSKDHLFTSGVLVGTGSPYNLNDSTPVRNTIGVGTSIPYDGGNNNAAGFFDGKICEIIYYQETLIDQKRQGIEEYLRLKWNAY